MIILNYYEFYFISELLLTVYEGVLIRYDYNISVNKEDITGSKCKPMKNKESAYMSHDTN